MAGDRYDVSNKEGDWFYLLICEIIIHKMVLFDNRQLNDKIRLGYFFSLAGLRMKSLTGYSFETIKLLIK